MQNVLRCIGILGFLFVTNAAASEGGKFYIVGMGTAPDLITVRGAEVIRQADIILLEEPSEQAYWNDFIGDKEVWFCPHGSRVGYGIDPEDVEDPDIRAIVERNDGQRREAVDKIKKAVAQGKKVAALEGGDPMIYGTTFYLEMLPEDFPSEIVPGIGAFQASSAAVKMSPVFGYDTNSVIVTMGDWPGRSDLNEKLMNLKTSMVFYAMGLKFPELFRDLGRHYPASTPVAVVSFAGDRDKERVLRSTVGSFMADVEYTKLPADSYLIMIGKFLEVGQARSDALIGIKRDIDRVHGGTPTGE